MATHTYNGINWIITTRELEIVHCWRKCIIYMQNVNRRTVDGSWLCKWRTCYGIVQKKKMFVFIFLKNKKIILTAGCFFKLAIDNPWILSCLVIFTEFGYFAQQWNNKCLRELLRRIFSTTRIVYGQAMWHMRPYLFRRFQIVLTDL